MGVCSRGHDIVTVDM